MVRGVRGAPEPELRGEAGLGRMEPPEGSQEPVARGPADQGVGVVQVPDVDAEEVSKPNDRCRGYTDSPFGDLTEEVSRGGEGTTQRWRAWPRRSWRPARAGPRMRGGGHW